MGNNISAILLAAGLSSRMGQPKLLLPWAGRTVLGQVVSTFAAAGMEEIIVVTGGVREQIERLVAELAKDYPVRTVYMAALDSQPRAALIGLGDQPQVREETVRRICAAFVQAKSLLVIPSFQNRRGHPWLVARLLWPKILALPTSTTSRQFLNTYAGQVEYVAADESILQDLDTPEDYARQRPYRVLRK
ncbi:MAG: nucleotidyltransferase family protein [Chloroflexi bacterium]|nr:nucleotidyltransferase family protein [Chloroflexota bacterium]